MTPRETVVVKTTQLLVEYGLKCIRMDDIAQQLGMSKRTLYEIFSDKEELLYECFLYMDDKISMQLNQEINLDKEGMKGMFKMMQLLHERTKDKRHLLQNLQKFYPALYTKVMKDMCHRGLERLSLLLNDFVKKGLVRDDINIPLSVAVFYYSADSLSNLKSDMPLPEGVKFEDAFAYMFVNYFRGIATIEGVHQIDEYIIERKKQN